MNEHVVAFTSHHQAVQNDEHRQSFQYYQKISQHSHTEYWFIPTQFTSLQNVHQKDVGLKHAHKISTSFFHTGL